MAYLYLFLILIASIVVGMVIRKWRQDVLSIPWRIHYLVHGFRARHRTFCPTILEEKNGIKRLLYLLPYVAASFTPVILIVPGNKLLLASLSYLYWRILDTFDDLLVGEEREKGLRILPERLRQLHQSGTAETNEDIENFHFSIVGPRDEIYIHIVQSMDRLDSIFLQLDEAQRDVLLRFSEYQVRDFLSVPETHFKTEAQYHEKCVTTIMTGLYLATFEINRSEYGVAMDGPTRKLFEDTCVSFDTGNVIKDLEKDFRQGISYHPNLPPRGIPEKVDPDEQEKIGEAREWLTYHGIQHLPSTCTMFQNEWDENYWTRLMALLLKTYLVNNYRKYWREIRGEPAGKLDTKRIFLGCVPTAAWKWNAAIVELDQDMLSWRPSKPALWNEGDLLEG